MDNSDDTTVTTPTGNGVKMTLHVCIGEYPALWPSPHADVAEHKNSDIPGRILPVVTTTTN